VELEIRPEPTDEERAALLSAVQPNGAEPEAYRGVWRLAGLLENVESGVDGVVGENSGLGQLAEMPPAMAGPARAWIRSS
jgi:hypothetical protein